MILNGTLLYCVASVGVLRVNIFQWTLSNPLKTIKSICFSFNPFYKSYSTVIIFSFLKVMFSIFKALNVKATLISIGTVILLSYYLEAMGFGVLAYGWTF